MLAKSRTIRVNGTAVRQTPLLVPSISSRAVPNARVADLLEFAASLIADEILISAYDVYFHQTPANLTFPSLVVVDSGGYEASCNRDLSEVTPTGTSPQSWSKTQYEEVLSRISFGVPTVLVSFDHPARSIPIEDQVSEAVDLFARFPQAAGNILLKPSPGDGGFLCVDRIVSKVELLAPFAVIGMTEKELGNSLMERLLNLARLRRALTAVGLDTPLHVFGSLDTVLPPLYFLAGADVFDGLTWLRYAFREGQTVYAMSHAAQSLSPDTNDSDAFPRIWSENYFELIRLQESMRLFAQSGRYSSFRYHQDFYQKMLHTLTTALEGI